MKLWLEKGAWASRTAKETAKHLTPGTVKKIAIIRHAAIGDMVILRPFIVELRRFFPNASITLSLVDSYSYGAPTDLVDEVHTVYKKRDGVKTSFYDRFNQFKALGEQDIIFDTADTAMSGWLTLLNKAKLKIGFPYHRVKNYCFYNVSILRSDLNPEIETLMHMLYILGGRDERPLDFAYPKYKVKRKSPYIVYFPSASVPKKCWPHFMELAEKMAKKYPMYQHVLLEGIKLEEKIELGDLSSFENISISPALPLNEAIKFLGESSLVIANDTGIRNMAIAAGARTVGLFFSTVPYRYWPRDGRHEVVFNADGSIPKVEKAFTCICKQLN